MDEDAKANLDMGGCEVCGSDVCSNCGKCCSCGNCDCDVCHSQEKDNEPHIKEPVNYP